MGPYRCHRRAASTGAPIGLVVPWTYGFKSAKPIFKISFTEKPSLTAWMRAAALFAVRAAHPACLDLAQSHDASPGAPLAAATSHDLSDYPGGRLPHYLWLVKKDLTEPSIDAAALALLLVMRLPWGVLLQTAHNRFLPGSY